MSMSSIDPKPVPGSPSARRTRDLALLGGLFVLVLAGLAVPEQANANHAARELREKLLSDPYRAGYHFVIPEGTAMPFDLCRCATRSIS